MTVDATPIYQVFTVTREAAGEVYPVTFPYISPEYVKCYYAVDKEQTQLVFGRDYTVNSETNELTVIGSVPVDAKLVIYRVTDLTQEIDWVDGQAVYTPDIEQADDKAMHILQELAEQTNRSVKITREEEAAGTNPEYRWEEIEQARNEVLAAKEATEQAKTDAETAKDEAELARDETLDARDTALETISNAQEDAQEAIYEGKQAAIADIGTAKDTALTDMADRKDDHIASINTAKSEALEVIEIDKQSALGAISTATQEGVAGVTQAKDSVIAEVNTSGAEWVQKAKTEADRSSSEADRAKSEADRAQQIVNLDPATKDKLGLVQIGAGLSITPAGVLSADAQPVSVATADTPGIVKPGNNMTVRADGTLDVEVPEPPAPYTLPTATADVLGGVKVGNGLSITPTGELSADAQPVDIATASKAGIVKPDSNMTVDDTGTITDKREVLYFEEMPEGGLPTEGVKEGAIAFIDDGKGGLPSGGSGDGSVELPELTEEHVIGYLNGKPVYEIERIYVNSATATTGATKIGSLSDLNIETIFFYNVVYIRKDGCVQHPYWMSSSNFMMCYFNPPDFDVIEQHKQAELNSATVNITIRYTKTTD